jgi:hypothetical protein
MTETRQYVAFAGERCVASGTLETVLTAVKTALETDAMLQPLFFEEQTGRQVDFDLRGTVAEALERALPQPVKAGRGRPRLGVVPREISLLPRHWEWLETQPHGASAALRRLVDEARKREGDEAEARRTREAVGRIMTAVGGNLPGFEEALRALYAVDREGFERRIAAWPEDLRRYLEGRAAEAFWTKQ